MSHQPTPNDIINAIIAWAASFSSLIFGVITSDPVFKLAGLILTIVTIRYYIKATNKLNKKDGKL